MFVNVEYANCEIVLSDRDKEFQCEIIGINPNGFYTIDVMENVIDTADRLKTAIQTVMDVMKRESVCN